MADERQPLPGDDFARIAEEEKAIENAYAARTLETALANHDAQVAVEKAKTQQAQVRALTMLVYGANGYNIFESKQS